LGSFSLVRVLVFRDHASHLVEQTISRRPLEDRARPLRHQADQEGHPDHPLLRTDPGFPDSRARRHREQIPVRAQRPLDHRRPRERKVFIRAIKNIEPGDEINYDYGTDYFKAYLKPIGCKCESCEKKRKKLRAEARAERAKVKARTERKAEKAGSKAAKKKKLNGVAVGKVNGRARA
jgi:hypothetical protein